VATIFGAMFAPKRFDVAREMVRVTRPGGRGGAHGTHRCQAELQRLAVQRDGFAGAAHVLVVR
jgi:hypothetical protein